ncbi:MAG: hypothetical protein K8J31_14215 [Anaerolineae bacterium]|nr:hypothetical protein [Anaerolineae bacterium]
MLPKRLCVKFFVSPPADVDLSKIVPIFQRWIQREWVEGMLIDIANYDHVHQGPGVILIGDEGDYALDTRDGKPGIMYTYKRQTADTLADNLRTASRRALVAGQKLSGERTLSGITFDYAQAQIMFLDRLNAPNTAEGLSVMAGEIESFVSVLYAGAKVQIDRTYSDPREPLSLSLTTAQSVRVEELIERLSNGETVTG